MSTQHKVIVVGGGISGLATAWWLRKASLEVLVLERGRTLGGTMQTLHEDGWLVETGPNSALETTPLFRSLFGDLGLSDEMLYANEAGNNRYILRDGNLHALPMTPWKFFRSKLWSTPGKLRLLKEPFVGRAKKEETIAEFVERRLGREFLDYAINPFVAGVYAGSPEQLSVQAAFPKLFALEKNYGGLIQGQIRGRRDRRKRAEQSKDRARMFSFRNGMQTFPDRIGAALGDAVHTEAEVQTIIENKTNTPARFTVRGMRKAKAFSYDADVVITAIPSQATATLVGPLDGPAGKALEGISYPPVVEVFLGFKAANISRSLDGFGFLVPEKEHRSILGTIWSSSLFPRRAPEGCVALTTFVGGSRQPELTGMSDEELTRTVVRELSHIMGVHCLPLFTHIARWDRAIPQYTIGHLSIIEQLERFEKEHPGIFLSGNFRGGISVGDCIISADRVARQVQEHVQNSRNSARPLD